MLIGLEWLREQKKYYQDPIQYKRSHHLVNGFIKGTMLCTLTWVEALPSWLSIMPSHFTWAALLFLSVMVLERPVCAAQPGSGPRGYSTTLLSFLTIAEVSYQVLPGSQLVSYLCLFVIRNWLLKGPQARWRISALSIFVLEGKHVHYKFLRIRTHQYPLHLHCFVSYAFCQLLHL